MKKFLFPAALVAVMTMASCNKQDMPLNPSQETPDAPKYELTVDFPDVEPATKVALSSTDNTVSNVQVMVFNAAGVLEASTNVTSTSASLSVTAGAKTVYAVANVPVATHSFLTATNAAAITTTATALSDNTIGGAFVMVGNSSVTVSGASASVSVALSRIASKIELGSIKLQLGTALAGKTLTVNRVYVQNAVVNSTFAKTKTLAVADFTNKGAFESGGSYASYLSKEWTTSNTIADGSTSTTFQEKYYCYPNQTTTDSHAATFSVRKTRLVVEATLNGRKTYYPVTLGPLEANKYYKVTTLTITGYGVDNPEDDPAKASLAVTVSVTDWVKGQEIAPSI